MRFFLGKRHLGTIDKRHVETNYKIYMLIESNKHAEVS
jgi:hypothetical protein